MVKTQGTSKHSKYVCSITYIEKANKSQDFSTQIHAEEFKLKNKLMSSSDIIYILKLPQFKLFGRIKLTWQFTINEITKNNN